MNQYLKTGAVLFGAVTSGCTLLPVSQCNVDYSLIQKLQICGKPEHPTNADLARCLRDIRLDIEIDNEKKEQLLRQLEVCNG